MTLQMFEWAFVPPNRPKKPFSNHHEAVVLRRASAIDAVRDTKWIPLGRMRSLHHEQPGGTARGLRRGGAIRCRQLSIRVVPGKC